MTLGMTAEPITFQKQRRAIARALSALSAKTGRPFSMTSKPGRFEIQKAVYLLRKLGYPAAARLSYNMYLNGPYSPDLAELYYALGDAGLRSASPAADLSPSTLDTVASAMARGPEFLEGLTTVVDGVTSRRDVQTALAWAKSIKPHLSEPTWKEVRAFLSSHKELIGHT